MKILKDGKIPVIKSKCPICGCEFEFVANEALTTDIHEEEDDSDFYSRRNVCIVYTMRCPCCNQLTSITVTKK